MARIHGRRGRVYIAIASGGTPEPVPFLSSWSLDAETDQEEVTAFGDGNKVYLAGLPDMSGSAEGFYDDATAQMWTAAIDGAARNTYLYPNTDAAGTYWFGPASWSFSIEVPVDGAASISADWTATGTWNKQQAA